MTLAALLLSLAGALPAPGEIARSIDSVLTEAADGSRLQIDHSKLTRLEPPAEAIDWSLSRRTRGVPGGTESFELTWIGTEKTLERRALTLRVKRFETVAVACSDLEHGQRVDSLCSQEVPAIGSGTQALRADSALGMRLRRTVTRGHVFLKGDVEAAPLALKGQAVTLHVVIGNARVDMPGVLLADAVAGRPVRVRNALGKEVSGTLDDDANVTVVAGLR